MLEKRKNTFSTAFSIAVQPLGVYSVDIWQYEKPRMARRGVCLEIFKLPATLPPETGRGFGSAWDNQSKPSERTVIELLI